MIQKDEFSKRYQNGEFLYSSDIYGNKDETEYLERCRYYYGMYASDECAIGFGGSVRDTSFKELRDYARGMQSAEKYRNQLDPVCYPKNKKKRPYRKWNISWRTNKILSKFRDRMKDKFEQLRLEPDVEATDESSAMMKNFIAGKMKLMADPRTKQFVQGTGFTLPGMKEVAGFDSPADVDSFKEMGGIMIPPEIDMKDAIDETLLKSQWKSLRVLLHEDKIDLGAYAAHVFINSAGKLEWEYIDPARYIRRWSEYPDGRDTDFKAFVKSRKISEIRGRINDPEKLKKIAETYKSVNGNERLFKNSGLRQNYDRTNGRVPNQYDECSVDVMTLYFIDTQISRFAKGYHSKGSAVFDKVKPDSEARNREMVDNQIHNLYKVNWIVGTDCIFDYGVADTIVRQGSPGSKEVVFPIYDYISQEPSLIERCIGFDDDIQIATFKIRNLIAKLPPAPRMVVDKSAIKNSVTIGDEEFSILENIQGYAATGILLVETQDAYSLPGAEGDMTRKRPIDFLPSGVVEDLNILLQQIQAAAENIRQVTGSNPLEDGNAAPDLLKHTAQSMTAGTNSALAPHIKDYVDGFERLCWITVQMWRLRVLNGDIQLDNPKRTTLTKELFYRDWNVNVFVDTSNTKDLLLQDLLSKRELIPDEIFYEIYNRIIAHDLKKAQLLLAKHSARAKEMEHQRVLEVQKAQAEGNAQAGVAVEQARQATLTAEYTLKDKLAAAKALRDEEMAKANHKRALELLAKEMELSKDKELAVTKSQQSAVQ